MKAQSATQEFGLGTLIQARGTSHPTASKVSVEGRGLFLRVRLSFEFPGVSDDSPGVFVLTCPWNAVVASVKLNGEEASQDGSGDEPRQVSANFEDDFGDLHRGRPGFACHIPEDVALKTLEIEFGLALQVLWHEVALSFSSPSGLRTVDFSGSWNTAGLPGAGVTATRGAGSVALEVIDSTSRWNSNLVVSPDEPANWVLKLDEKKAASLSLFSPPRPGVSKGCAAVAVVAPVRPQLVRETASVTMAVELRNPQEGLAVRELVEKSASALRPDDRIRVFLLGGDKPREALPWTPCEDLDDDALAPLLEPSAVGRCPNLAAALKKLGRCEESTYLILATAGSSRPQGSFEIALPTFIYATGRQPNRRMLESVAEPTGGYVCEQLNEGLECFLERMRTRMSPPLLRDFRLEGWGLDEVFPPDLTQVYTDEPTLVFGLYDGLLPKTVTLTGYSPAGQKLAQRVRVESVEEFDFLPLYQAVKRRWEGTSSEVLTWQASSFLCYSFSHPKRLQACFEVKQAAGRGSAEGLDLMEPPKLTMVNTAVTLDDETFGGIPSSEMEEETLFAPSPVLEDSGTELRLQKPPSFEDESEEEMTAPSLSMGSPVRIAGSQPIDFDEDDEPEETPSLGDTEEKDFDVPMGPPQIFGSGAGLVMDDEPEEELSGKTLEPGAHIQKPRKMPSFAKSSEEEAPPEETAVPEPEGSATPPAAAAAETPPEIEQDTIMAAGRGQLSSWRDREPGRDESSDLPWDRRLLALEPASVVEWLNSCSIDDLGLALAELEPQDAERFLSKLKDPRRRAVDTQRKLGELLEAEERQQAGRQLIESLGV